MNINNIRLSGVKGALIPVEIGITSPAALVDTGATRSCLSGAQYLEMGQPPFTALCKGTVRAATGGDMQPLGFLECSVKIQERVYQHEFIVCQNMVSAVILGIDFLRKFDIRISWGDQGRIKLKEGTNNLIHSVSETVHYPLSLSKNVTVPPRTVANVVALTDLPEPETKIMYKITADNPPDPGGSAITYPLCYATMVGEKQKCAQIMVNLGQEKLTLKRGTILGYFEKWADEAASDPNISESDWISACGQPEEESEEGPFKDAEMGFLKSSADVDPREPIVLKDAEVPPEAQKSFEKLCDELADIFSKDSSDLGKTPLLKMDIPTGDSPPVSQKPYTLALKHVQWVREEIEMLEKAGVIVRSISPWASPIVIVPKKTAQGEPPRRHMCVDYCILNSLLLRVDKAHSKAKGILTLVPIPKIDEIYAKLEGLTIYPTFDMRSAYYHLELTPESQSKSAFVVGGPRGGKWEFKRCPFGLTQATAYFQPLVSKVIEGLPFAFR